RPRRVLPRRVGRLRGGSKRQGHRPRRRRRSARGDRPRSCRAGEGAGRAPHLRRKLRGGDRLRTGDGGARSRARAPSDCEPQSLAPCVSSVERNPSPATRERSEEHTSELQSPDHLVCRLLLEKKKKNQIQYPNNSNQNSAYK